MKSKDNLPQKGDIITSTKFAYGYYESKGSKKKGRITVDGKTTKYPMGYYLSEEERVALAAKTGKIPPKERVVELGAYDESRGGAKFVVEEARMQGGSHDTRGDLWPDGWYIVARRLHTDGKYDENGETIEFYMSGCFTCMVESKDIEIVGKMKARFI